MRIAIDIMGGDFAPNSTLMGSKMALDTLGDNTTLYQIGDKQIIKAFWDTHGGMPKNVIIVPSENEILMGDHPIKAFNSKLNSSIVKGFSLLKSKEVDCFASVGNTGAMQVGAMFSIKSITGVIRPCVTSVLPRDNNKVGIILDVGANSDCKPDVLLQFGILGSLYAEHVCQIKNPRVALLNIGEEEEKGNLLTQAAHRLMKDNGYFTFVGNIESRHLFDDHADVIVCDGFTGNVVLKQAEAFYTLVKKRGFDDEFFNRFNYEIYGGTPILGINGNVLIGHGISSPEAIKNMILLSESLAEAELPKKIESVFS
ncbi:MAG: phosphate acyltransferase [Luteibaculaceae bacterium]